VSPAAVFQMMKRLPANSNEFTMMPLHRGSGRIRREAQSAAAVTRVPHAAHSPSGPWRRILSGLTEEWDRPVHMRSGHPDASEEFMTLSPSAVSPPSEVALMPNQPNASARRSITSGGRSNPVIASGDTSDHCPRENGSSGRDATSSSGNHQARSVAERRPITIQPTTASAPAVAGLGALGVTVRPQARQPTDQEHPSGVPRAWGGAPGVSVAAATSTPGYSRAPLRGANAVRQRAFEPWRTSAIWESR